MTNATQEQDWSACEIVDDEDEQLGLSRIPEAMVMMKHPDTAVREQEFAKFKALLDQFIPRDDASVVRCGRVVERFKSWAKDEEADRKRQLEPHEKVVNRINSEILPVVKIFTEGARLITERVNQFLDEREKAAELEQRKRIEDARLEQEELDRKAAAAREAATVAEANGNASKASVLEMKADLLEQKAAAVVPVHVELPSKKVELGGLTVSFGGAKKVWALPGWADRKKPLRVNDPALAKLVGDITKLPAGIQFILQHADLNPVYLNASYKGGTKFPEPFVESKDYSKSTVRG